MKDKPARMSRKKKSVDPRARKTRSAIAGALMKLSAEKGLDGVNAKELTAAAGVGRSTFYAHFDSKEDFLVKSFADLIRRLDADALTRNPSRHVFPALAYFKHAANSKKYAHAMASSASYADLRQQREIKVREIILRNLTRMSLGDAQSQARIATMLSGAFMSLTHAWMLAGLKEQPESLDAAFRTLSDAAVSTLASQ